MTYEQANGYVADLRQRFDAPYGDTDKHLIASLYYEALGKTFTPTTCQQCYHDAVIEIYIFLKRNKAMAQKSKYRMKAGFIIGCPDFHNGKIYTNDNLTDKIAKEFLTKYPHMESYFQRLPEEEESTNE